jgi:hypothetical protein
MKKYLLIAALLPLWVGAQSKGLADELYEEYEPKPYVSGFSFGGSILSALPVDLDFSQGRIDRNLNGEIKRIQWLRISDERYLKEVSENWEKFLSKARYKKIELDHENGEPQYLYVRGTRTHFDEAHFLIREEESTILLTVYGDFTLNRTNDED